MQLEVVVIIYKLQWENKKDGTNMKEKTNKKDERISQWGTLYMTVRGDMAGVFLPFTDSIYKIYLNLESCA